MPSINRVEPYTALADVYQAAGFATYSTNIGQHLLDMIFNMDWLGHHILDLACGTGDLACWFAAHGFRSTGVDLSPAMLQFGTAAAQKDSLAAEFVQGDMRMLQPPAQFDLVTCMGGSLNYIATLRDLESVFRQAALATAPGKLFVFDLQTIQGLASVGAADHIVCDNHEDILIVTHRVFNYELLLLTVEYIILRYLPGTGWQRADETHILRGYPVQAVTSLLARTGFKLLRTVTPDMQPADTQRDASQLIFVAMREPA